MYAAKHREPCGFRRGSSFYNGRMNVAAGISQDWLDRQLSRGFGSWAFRGFKGGRQGWRGRAQKLSVGVVLLACFLCHSVARAEHPAAGSVEAARLNNVGVAYMNQQLTDKALQKFDAAHATDNSAAVPLLNKGIALLYLRKLGEAEEALKAASTLAPNDPRAWYSLGLARFDGGSQQEALVAFQHAAQLDPADADSHYFVGTIELGLKDFDHAAAEFETAIKLNPLHASAQFGLARALQRAGKADEAREHLKRFQEITQAKIGTPLSAVYGEQGRYATVQDMRTAVPDVGPMIPVTFVQAKGLSDIAPSVATASSHGGGSCILDIEGKGEKDIIVVGQGEKAFRAYRVTADGASEISLQSSGLGLSGVGVSCAVGDYDNDGRPDLALALEDRVVVFKNLGAGKFQDTTSALGIRPLNRPSGLTFVDFDHDGDLDLYRDRVAAWGGYWGKCSLAQ